MKLNSRGDTKVTIKVQVAIEIAVAVLSGKYRKMNVIFTEVKIWKFKLKNKNSTADSRRYVD